MVQGVGCRVWDVPHANDLDPPDESPRLEPGLGLRVEGLGFGD